MSLQSALAVLGDDLFECQCALRKVARKYPYLDECGRGGLMYSLNSMIRGRRLVVISDMSADDLHDFREFVQDPNPELFLFFAGYKASNLKRKKKDTSGSANYLMEAVETLTKRQVLEFKKPPFYKEREVAVAFLIQALQKQGKSLSKELSEAIVSRVGTDKGVLSFEARKIALYAGPESVITPKLVTPVIAALAETPLDQLSAALVSRNEDAVISCLQKIRKTYDQPVMLLSSYLLGKVESWLVALDFMEKKLAPDQCADLLGRNAWEYEQNVYKPAKSFTRPILLKLLQAVCDTQHAQLEGEGDPLSLFETLLIQALW